MDDIIISGDDKQQSTSGVLQETNNIKVSNTDPFNELNTTAKCR